MRLGEATATFYSLLAIWKHSNIKVGRKLLVFKALVISKLLFSLDVYCLRKSDRNRIDAFYVRCLRKILGIPHSMISHVTNATVLQRANSKALSEQLAQKQLLLYGRISRLPNNSMLRQAAFDSDSIEPKQFTRPHRRGRPRLAWSSTTYARALAVCNFDAQILQTSLQSQDIWQEMVWRHFN